MLWCRLHQLVRLARFTRDLIRVSGGTRRYKRPFVTGGPARRRQDRVGITVQRGSVVLSQPRARAFVAYYRVSTDKQGQSGLGLDAQRAAVELHARSVGAEVVAEFQDVESGRKADRAGLAAALATCRAKRATLLIAKLDRLARSVAFISNLMEGGVDFVAADMPSVNRLTVHVLAAVAEHEREMIAQRTKAALAAAKVRGTRLGNPRLPATGTLAPVPVPVHARGQGQGRRGAGPCGHGLRACDPRRRVPPARCRWATTPRRCRRRGCQRPRVATVGRDRPWRACSATARKRSRRLTRRPRHKRDGLHLGTTQLISSRSRARSAAVRGVSYCQ